MAKATQTIGKQGELMVIGELLKRGFDVYLPAVDIGGVERYPTLDDVKKSLKRPERKNIAPDILKF